jgi:hypothetical protein
MQHVAGARNDAPFVPSLIDFLDRLATVERAQDLFAPVLLGVGGPSAGQQRNRISLPSAFALLGQTRRAVAVPIAGALFPVVGQGSVAAGAMCACAHVGTRVCSVRANVELLYSGTLLLSSCFLQLTDGAVVDEGRFELVFVLVFVLLVFVDFERLSSFRLRKGRGHALDKFAQARCSDEFDATFMALFRGVEFAEDEDADGLVDFRPVDSGPGPKEARAAGMSCFPVVGVDEVQDNRMKLGIHGCCLCSLLLGCFLGGVEIGWLS